MSLRARVDVRLGHLHVDVDVEVAPGEMVALLGPNGAGKTTVLRALAGLVALDGGHIHLDDQPLDHPEGGVWVGPAQRSVGMAFQDHRLFPTLSVIENVAFGLRARGLHRRASRRRASDLLDRFGLQPLAGLKPSALSGGQAQRVALARALAPRPRLLLLDEPLAALDAGTRVQVRRELAELMRGFDGMRLLVTHDPLDAHALADRVVVIEAGRVAQRGTLAGVTAHPRSPYVARLADINLLSGVADPDGTVRVATSALRFVAGDQPRPGPVHVAIHPRSVALHRTRPSGSPRNVWPGAVAEIDRVGDRVRVTLTDPAGLVAEITPVALAELELEPGSALWASVKAAEVEAYPA